MLWNPAGAEVASYHLAHADLSVDTIHEDIAVLGQRLAASTLGWLG